MLWFVNPGKPKRRTAQKRRNPRRVSRGTRSESGFSVPEWQAKPRSKARTAKKVREQLLLTERLGGRSVRYHVNPKKKRGKAMKLYGAALKARNKRLAKSRRKRRYRKNPAQVATPAYRSGWDATFGSKKKRAPKRAAAKRPKKKRSGASGGRKGKGRRLTGSARAAIMSMKRMSREEASERRQIAKIQKKRKTKGKKRSTKRKTAAAGIWQASVYNKKPKRPRKKKAKGAKKTKKKSTAAARRTTTGGGSMAKKKKKSGRKGRRTKAQYRAAGLKAARTRKRNKAKRSGKGRKKGSSRSRSKRRYKSRRFGIRSLQRARRMIRRKGRKRNTRARRFIRRHKMRSNPSLKGLLDTVKQVLPVAGAFYASRILASKVTSIPAVGGLVGRLGMHAPVAVAAVTLVGGSFAVAKVRPLAKYASAIMTGLGLNLVFTAIDAYAPASVKGFIGVGDDGLYDEALSEYQNVGEYDSVEGYENVGEYEHGASELGALGPGPSGDESGYGGGIFASANGGWGG